MPPTRLAWEFRLVDLDQTGVDASAPASGWSGRSRSWLLAGRLPWLVPAEGAYRTARVTSRDTAGRLRSRRIVRPTHDGVPLSVAVPVTPGRAYRAGAVTLVVHGTAPDGDWVDAMQRRVAAILDQWLGDLLPAGTAALRRLDMLWLSAPVGTDAGFLASAASHAILMQAVPDPAASEDRLRAATLLIGAHEGFHSLMAALPGARPAWVNESWASFFAFRAARPHLRGGALSQALALVHAPEAPTLIAADRAFRDGDPTAMAVLYGKGARFWAAIDAVVTGSGTDTGSGRLAALIRVTRGFEGVDWMDADAVAAVLDRHSAGRARPIVRCFLVEPACAAADNAGMDGL